MTLSEALADRCDPIGDRRFLTPQMSWIAVAGNKTAWMSEMHPNKLIEGKGKGGQVSPPLNISEIKTVQIRGNFLCPRGRVWPKKLGK